VGAARRGAARRLLLPHHFMPTIPRSDAFLAFPPCCTHNCRTHIYRTHSCCAYICRTQVSLTHFPAQYTSPPSTPGHIVDLSGKKLAEHDGLWHYTIGQRARVAGMDGRWFVAKKGVGASKQDILVVPGA
jgi:hypothetical protein